MSARNSLNLRGPARSDQITFGAQAPAITAMHSVSMQVSGGSGLRLRVIFRTMSGNQVSLR
ncbi:hypothetical protein GCM10011360_04890 [Primorskyibacter flagellatus]|uniref:Uncharacterized protein n=1 Tax=Primorskyibacter flagellatus TaxID=1387277 RepID=A0A916ZYI3_9RHOB|nr:hypothetical protein GCM10011360_04890 [Primorskyibacter flagellatus]